MDKKVNISLDMSRIRKKEANPIFETKFNNIIQLGQEIDLLESIRTQENPEKDLFTCSKDEIYAKALSLDIDLNLLDKVMFPKFDESGLIDLIDEDTIEVKYQTQKKIYNYGSCEINNFNLEEKKFLSLIERTTINPLCQDEFNILDDEKKNNIILNYLNSSGILTSLNNNDSIYYSSPKIFNDKKLFEDLITDESLPEISQILNYVSEVPGIPIMNNTFDSKYIQGLILAGAIDPIHLTVGGISKNYLVAKNNVNIERYDEDNLDQVKMTLVNFRHGQLYSKWRLFSPKLFLNKLLNDGYAGDATPIGTDYKELEMRGIVSVEKTEGTKYRLWVKKEDVIRDTLDLMEGSAPIIEKNPDAKIHDLTNSTLTRMMISKKTKPGELNQYLRDIQKGI